MKREMLVHERGRIRSCNDRDSGNGISCCADDLVEVGTMVWMVA